MAGNRSMFFKKTDWPAVLYILNKFDKSENQLV